jgi:glycosyltransferase involved in cell wall biosynthesis
MKENRILFFCPLPKPYMGQSIASDIIYKAIKPKFVINYSITLTYKIFGTLKVFLHILWVVIFHKIDTLYFTCTRSLFGAIKDILIINLCSLKGVKIINHLHGNDLNNLFRKGPLQKILMQTYRKIDTTIVLFEGQKKDLAIFKNMKVIVIDNCYDGSFDNIIVDFSVKQKDEIRIIFLSNLMASKGIFHFLSAAEQILNQYNNVVIDIAGIPISDYIMDKNSVKRIFDDKFASLKSKYINRIFYHGAVYGAEKTNLLAKSSIFVLPTFHKTEAFPISILEGMRMGNAIVTTNHNFLPEIIGENEGVLVEPNNEVSLINGMIYLIENKELTYKMGVHNEQIAKVKYAPKRFIDELSQLIVNN